MRTIVSQHDRANPGHPIAYTLGIAFRFGLHSNPDSSTLYILYYLFVTLSPCGFIAAEYVLLGRMARWLDGHRHVLIPPNRITLCFVMSDVITFLTQVRDIPFDGHDGEFDDITRPPEARYQPPHMRTRRKLRRAPAYVALANPSPSTYSLRRPDLPCRTGDATSFVLLLHLRLRPLPVPHAQVREPRLGARPRRQVVQRLACARRGHVCELHRRPRTSPPFILLPASHSARRSVPCTARSSSPRASTASSRERRSTSSSSTSCRSSSRSSPTSPSGPAASSPRASPSARSPMSRSARARTARCRTRTRRTRP